MRIAVVVAALAWAMQHSGTAAADLYRWIDPETGSVKFSSYPPPWYGDEAKQRRGPKVEVIPAGREVQAKPDEPAKGPVATVPAAERRLESLEAQRRALLQQLQAAAAGGPKALEKPAQALAVLSEQLDKLDPQGAQRRRAEAEALMQDLLKGAPR